MMMKEWRSMWYSGTGGATDPQFPMGFVQIGPMTNDEGNNPDSFLIRMGQTAGYGYAPNPRWPNAFMGTAFDLANPPGTKCIAGCIHIFNKQCAAHRLAVAARSMIYNETIVYSGPRITSAAVSGSVLTLTYDKVGTEGQGIKLRGSYGFEVTMDGTNWTRVNATSATQNTVSVALPSAGLQLKQVRYCFEDQPSIFLGTGPAVFNGEGLPATPSMINITSSA